MTSRRRARIARRRGGVQDYPAALHIGLDVVCEGGPDGPAHASHRIWRFLVDTHQGAEAPNRWGPPEEVISIRPNRDGALPEPYAGGPEADRYRDADGGLWIPCDCEVCGRQLDVPLRWVRDQLAAAWEPNIRRVLRHLL